MVHSGTSTARRTASADNTKSPRRGARRWRRDALSVRVAQVGLAALVLWYAGAEGGWVDPVLAKTPGQ